MMEKSKMATIKPLDDRVLVKPDDAEEKTAGGIVLPGSAQERPTRGKVIAAGPGKLGKDGNRIALSVKEGDTVIYGEYAGSTIKIGGEEHKIVRESDLLGVLE